MAICKLISRLTIHHQSQEQQLHRKATSTVKANHHVVRNMGLLYFMFGSALQQRGQSDESLNQELGHNELGRKGLQGLQLPAIFVIKGFSLCYSFIAPHSVNRGVGRITCGLQSLAIDGVCNRIAR